MWLFVGVDDLMSAQGASLPEPLAANLADERPGPGVHGHVSRQVVVSVEHFPAVQTSKSFLLSVLGTFGPLLCT